MNCVEAKQLTNIRAAGADEKVFLTPPRQFSLEEMIPYMMPDEMVEVPPRARTKLTLTLIPRADAGLGG